MRLYKYYLLILLSVVTYLQSEAQQRDYPACQFTYFAKTKKVSTSECYDKEKHWGLARAFDKNGKTIYEKNLRRIAGHSSVTFKYYSNGAVKQADWSDAPDAGIQWYRGTTYFAEDGTITNEVSNSYEGPGREHLLVPKLNEKPALKPAETVKCAEVNSSEIWVENTTHYEIQISAQHANQKCDTVVLPAHKKLKVTECIEANHFEDPEKYYKFEAKTHHTKKHIRLIVLPADKKYEDMAKNVRRYYFEVRRVI